MLGVFERAGFELTRRARGAVSSRSSFELAATERYELSVEERDHVAVRASLRPFFQPASVAVVGASSRSGTIGGELFRNVLEGDFAGVAYPVNRKGEPVAGVRGYRSVAEIDATGRPGRDLGARRARARRRRGCAARRRARARRHLGRLRGDRQRGCRAAGAAARARSLPRGAADRPELPRRRRRRPAPERDVRGALGAERQHRLLVPVRRARAGTARGDGVARARPLRVRLDREQGGRLVERPARVVGGRRRDESRAPVRRVVRQPAALRPPGPAGRSPQADPRAQERDDSRRGSGPPAPIRPRSQAQRRPSTRCSTRRA